MKDKTNLLSYNQWSATDYLNNTNDFTYDPLVIKAEQNNQFSTIGENSLKITLLSTTSSTGKRVRIYCEDKLISKTLNLTCNIKTNNCICEIFLVEEFNITPITQRIVRVPENTSKSIKMSLDTSSNENSVYFIQFYIGCVNIPVYIDNINLSLS